MASFYDLGVSVDNDAALGTLKQVLSADLFPLQRFMRGIPPDNMHSAQAELANCLIRLGYSGMAYNISLTAPLKKGDR
jgi:hypothetical protein